MMQLKMGFGVSLLAVSAVGLAAVGAERPEVRWAKQAHQDGTVVESSLDLVVQELETLPDDATVQLTEDLYPEVYRFFRGRIAAKHQAGSSPSKTPGCCGAGGSLRAVPTTGGILGVLDRGDGVVHVLLYAINKEDPDLGDTDGLALSAIITDDGVEVLWMDMDRLARFIGGESDVVTPDGGAASVDEGDDDVGETQEVALDCHWGEQGVCCAVVTETRFCVCCATLIPIKVGCDCTTL